MRKANPLLGLLPALGFLAAPLLAQDGAQDVLGPQQTPEDQWRDFDGVAMIINDDIITLRELDKMLKDARGMVETTTDAESAELVQQVAEVAVARRLQTQAGKNIGIPSDDVERTIDRFLAANRRDRSAQETADWMAERGAGDLGQLRTKTRDELYRQFWESTSLGEPAGAMRASRDRFVRPGQLREAYRINVDSLAQPPTVIFQFLALSTAAWGDAETARESLIDLRAEILAGADMGAMVDEYGASLRETRGISPRVPITRVDDPQLAAFATEAEEGALSEVLEILGPDGEPQGYQIARIVNRTAGQPAPEFESPAMQVDIADKLQSSWDKSRLTVSSDNLWRTAFIRTPPALQLKMPWERRAGR